MASSTVTSCPGTELCTKLAPMNPAPPVTSNRMVNDPSRGPDPPGSVCRPRRRATEMGEDPVHVAHLAIGCYGGLKRAAVGGTEFAVRDRKDQRQHRGDDVVG